MKTLSLGIFLCLFSAHVYASGGRSVNDTSLIDINQNLLFRPELTSFQSAPSYKTASVHFIVSKDNKLGFEYTEPSFQVKTTDQCKTLGFEKTGSCGANEYKAHTCPWDETRYDYCCDLNYSYTVGQCSYPRTLSSDSCGGKFKCYCDRALYPETSCSAPYIPSDDKCTDTTFAGGIPTGSLHYAACVCPDNWVQCDSSIHQKGNGAACTYRGKTTYESCGCEGGYTQTCDDFGPRTPSDYCFLKGTKYYKDCKTGSEICEGMGFKHSTSNPCSADEIIGDYCPKDGTYYSCKIDPVKYCKNHGYSNAGCAKYETVSTDVCEYDSSYKKCIPTCKSRLAELGYYELNDKLWYKNRTAVVWDDFDVFDSKNPQGYEYENVWGRNAFANSYSECSTFVRPNLTIGANSNHTLMTKNLDSIRVIIDHKGTENLGLTSLEAGGLWHDVTVTETNAGDFGSQSHSSDYGDFHIMKKDTRVRVKGTLTLTGNNNFYKGDIHWDVNGEGKELLGLFHLELNDEGKVYIKSGITEFYGVPIFIYETTKGSEFVVSGGASLKQYQSSFQMRYSDAYLKITEGSTFNTTVLDIAGAKNQGYPERFLVTGGSQVYLGNRLYLDNTRLGIYGNSRVDQKGDNIGAYHGSGICIGLGSTLCSSYKYGANQGTCQSGRAAYTVGGNSKNVDWVAAGYSDWYKTDYTTYKDKCPNGD